MGIYLIFVCISNCGGYQVSRTYCQVSFTTVRLKKIEPRPRETLSSGFATSLDSNRPAQLMRLARVLKFRL